MSDWKDWVDRYPLDSETGLPVIPEGYFWRITSSHSEHDFNPTIRVDLRKYKVPAWYLRKGASESVHGVSQTLDDQNKVITGRSYYRHHAPKEASTLNDTILNLAMVIMREEAVYMEEYATRSALKKELDKREGDYPPRSLHG